MELPDHRSGTGNITSRVIREHLKLLEWKPIGRRIRGRPRKIWFEDVEEDIQRMGIRGWRKLCKERAEWKRITE